MQNESLPVPRHFQTSVVLFGYLAQFLKKRVYIAPFQIM